MRWCEIPRKSPTLDGARSLAWGAGRDTRGSSALGLAERHNALFYRQDLTRLILVLTVMLQKWAVR